MSIKFSINSPASCKSKILHKMNSSHAVLYSWSTPIDKLMLWRGSWTKYDSKMSNSFLRVHYDQLLLTADTKILESYNMHQKIKGIYKGDVLILIVNNSCKEIRKIKFQIKSNVAQCLQKLGEHFPVINHNIKQANHLINANYRNIDEVLKHALERKDEKTMSSLPPAFSNFMKLCLLDPTFPQMVFEAEKIVNNEINKN